VATTTRRELLGVTAAWIAVSSVWPFDRAGARPASAPETRDASAEVLPRFAYVGSFATSTRGAHGEGLSVFAIDASTSRWSRVQLLSSVVNPGYLALDPRRPVLYAVQPGADEVSAFAIDDRSGELTLINRQPSGGNDPSHLAIDPAGKFLVAANYVAGTVEILPVNADGSLGAPTDVVATKGEPGPHRTEQPGPHPHQCPFDPSGRFVVVPDKGFDRLFVFTIGSATGRLVPADPPSARTRSGAGPRHIAFHPRLPNATATSGLVITCSWFHTECGRNSQARMYCTTESRPKAPQDTRKSA
jgi:6-phosphogluconolactonase (cycloisomerase 2 family)